MLLVNKICAAHLLSWVTWCFEVMLELASRHTATSAHWGILTVIVLVPDAVQMYICAETLNIQSNKYWPTPWLDWARILHGSWSLMCWLWSGFSKSVAVQWQVFMSNASHMCLAARICWTDKTECLVTLCWMFKLGWGLHMSHYDTAFAVERGMVKSWQASTTNSCTKLHKCVQPSATTCYEAWLVS